MPHQNISVDELARQLGRDRRVVEKLADRGRIPGRKVSGVWQFHPTEIRHWLEREMRGYSGGELKTIERTQRSTKVDAGIPVSSLLSLDTVQVPLGARTKRSVLSALIEAAGRSWQVWKPAEILAAVLNREEVMSTGYENGVAIPHPRNPVPDSLGASVVAYGRTWSGIPFGAPRRQLTDLFFLVLCEDSRTHLQVLARLGRMLQLPDFTQRLREAEDSRAAYHVICEADRSVAQG